MAKQIEVCVVDDEQIVCDRLRPMIEKSGFTAETFTNSGAALKRLAEKNFDILVTDVKMAGADGLELMRFAKLHNPEIKVIVITGFATVETAREAMRGGATDFITKPFRMSALHDLITKISDEIQCAQGSNSDTE